MDAIRSLCTSIPLSLSLALSSFFLPISHSCVCLCVYRVPHIHDSVLGNILEAYGHTPLVKLDKIAKAEGLECDLCKCEQVSRGECIVLRSGK